MPDDDAGARDRHRKAAKGDKSTPPPAAAASRTPPTPAAHTSAIIMISQVVKVWWHASTASPFRHGAVHGGFQPFFEFVRRLHRAPEDERGEAGEAEKAKHRRPYRLRSGHRRALPLLLHRAVYTGAREHVEARVLVFLISPTARTQPNTAM